MSLKTHNLTIPAGTRDFAPNEVLLRDNIINKIKQIYHNHGGNPIETPTYENKSVLLNKYGDDEKLVFDLDDQGGSMCCLRYDLTVPFARYMAMNGLINMKRYQIGQVYRRDKPAIEQGRYRAFMQSDFDIAGEYDLMKPDSEIIKITTEILTSFNINFVIKINHKDLLFNLLANCNIAKDKLSTCCSSIDKLDKMSWDDIKTELLEKQITPESIVLIEKFINIKGHPADIIKTLKSNFASDETINKNLADIELLFEYLKQLKIFDKIRFDLSLARGLDYYTGIIFEAIVVDKKKNKIGSIAAGGRYDNLIGQYHRQQVPSVGCSIGIERIYNLLENKKPDTIKNPTAKCYVTCIGDYYPDVVEITSMLWDNNISAEICHAISNKLTAKIVQVSKKNIPYMIIIASNEKSIDSVIVKHMNEKTQTVIKTCDLINYLKDK